MATMEQGGIIAECVSATPEPLFVILRLDHQQFQDLSDNDCEKLRVALKKELGLPVVIASKMAKIEVIRKLHDEGVV